MIGVRVRIWVEVRLMLVAWAGWQGVDGRGKGVGRSGTRVIGC